MSVDRLRFHGRSALLWRSPKIALVAATAALLLCLGLGGAPAYAKIVHRFSSSFNGSDAPEGPFFFPLADAVDSSGGSSNGDVYVGSLSSSFQSSIYKFDASGKYVGPQTTGIPLLSFSSFGNTGVAVDNSTSVNKGDLYVGDIEHEVVDRVSESGTILCEITGSATPAANECNVAGSATPAGSFSPRGVIVDASGDVYVADGAHQVIDEFGPSGNYVGQIQDPDITLPGPIAVDTLGHVYVANATAFFGGTDVVKCSISPPADCSVLDNNSAQSVAVDRSNNVYVGEKAPKQIAEYDAAGNVVETFGSEQAEKVVSLAVSPNGAVYAVNAQNLGEGTVEIFSAVVLPDVTTSQATEVSETEATLHGHVDPDTADGGGPITSCQFEYGTSESYGSTAPCSPTPSSSPVDVNAAVANLSPSKTYHFRLEASNANGASYGADQAFSTFGPPVVDSESSSQVGAHTAALEAEINPFGYDTTCKVQYVDETSFASSGYANAATMPCTPSDLGSDFGDQRASANLSGLAIGTTYHYRFVATNSAAPAGVNGADQTFATFGIESFKVQALDREGHPYTQAGGHPYELTTEIKLNTTTIPVEGRSIPSPDENVKDIHTELPPGLIGDPTVAGTCTRSMVPNFECPGDAQVGILFAHTAGGSFEEPIYNLVPPVGTAAEWGARISNSVSAYIDFHIRTGGDYGIDADSVDISANAGVFSVSLTVWGVPAEPSHDSDRFCPGSEPGAPTRGCSVGTALKPFLTNPTSCTGPQTARLSVDSWQHQGEFVSAESSMPEVTGCERLDFTPSIEVKPDTSTTDSPSGLHVHLSVPQNDNPTGLAEAELKDATVALPAGVTINPSSANGLAACSPAQIGMDNANEPTCPNASKIGSAKVVTPLLHNPLEGAVYVAQQDNNPFHSLLAIYVVAEDPTSGVLIKLAGHVVADPLTGRLTTTFANNPQAPFSDVELELFGGPRGPLLTPQKCGSYMVTSSLTPWSGGETVKLVTPIPVSEGCTKGFAPAFAAGATDAQAGAFSPFSLGLSRADSDQPFNGFQFTLPRGVSARLAGVALCSDADLASSACPGSSLIGTVGVCSGGGSPIFLPGNIYLTGPYNGGPYGTAVIVPAIAGPFNLGDVVVRGSIRIDPHTAQATVVSDPFPQMVGQTGIPTDTRCVHANLDRSGFMLNPTSCSPMAVTGLLTSTEGAQAALSSHFQVANCAGLPFKPKFAVVTRAKHSRANGAYLRVSLSSKLGQANIAKVHVSLPRVLPSRQSTLRLACPQAQFAVNPSGCPAGSFVGTATAHTPLLSLPLSGPAIFVSHGGAKFPDLDIVLQGNGITMILVGNTFISKGITTSTFATVPDVPVERFELVLPAGPHSALAATANLCKRRLSMPTTITGQNGAVVKRSTKIGVAGCAKKRKGKHRTPAFHVKRHSKKGGARKRR